MFDWFREMGEELGGIDSVASKKERMEKREQKKLNRFIFSSGMKILIIALGVLYVVMAGSMIVALKGTAEATPYIFKYAIMSIVSLVIIFALIFGKKKGEIVALVGSFIFVVGMFFSIVFA